MGDVGRVRPMKSHWRSSLILSIAIQLIVMRPVIAQEQQNTSAADSSTAITRQVTIALSGNASSGNKSFSIVNGRLAYERIDSVYELIASSRASYRTSEGDEVAKDWALRVSFDTTPYSRLSVFSFAEIEENSVRKLSLRASMGAGGKWTILRTAKDEFSVSGALLAATEKHESGYETPDSSTWRWSIRVKKDLEISSFDLSTAWFVQPVIDELHDYLVVGIVRLSQKLTDIFWMDFTFDFFHDSDPPMGIKRSDYRFLVGTRGTISISP